VTIPSKFRHDHPSKLRRGTCPACNRDVAIRKGGLCREHRDAQMIEHTCPGSGRTHLELQAALAARNIPANRTPGDPE